jgi:hypothetical protein
MDPRGWVITKVDPIVEAHEQCVGISVETLVNICLMTYLFCVSKNATHSFPIIPVLELALAGKKHKEDRQDIREHEIYLMLVEGKKILRHEMKREIS